MASLLLRTEISMGCINVDRFVNMMYDFQFSVPGTYGQVCQLTDSIHNSDPIVGCHFFQAGVSFAAISWYPFPYPCTFNGTGFCGPFQ
jgi:hypothetical protein